jgi:dihydrofolate synthase/folylpolyglutamate synthase
MGGEQDYNSQGTPYLTMPHWPKLLFDNRAGTPLSRTQELLARVGNPQKRLPPVVHVSGTNGKGSTIAFLRAMLEAAGYKVHIYTSPHLHRFNERIVLAGREIDDTTLFTVIEKARLAAGEDSYSFFEGTTVAAFLAFAQTPADIVLIETGLGGRFDPTNVIENPLLNIITTISPDHMDILGQTLGEIAWHKAGIMRESAPCILSFQPEEAQAVLVEEAAQTNTMLCCYAEHWMVQRTASGFRYINSDSSVDFPPPALLGPHQYVNAGNAITAVTLLEHFDVDMDAITAGLQNVRWPGRMERITEGSCAILLPAGFELWMDGGHNMAAGHMLSVFFEEHWQDKPTYIIFGTTQGKDVVSLLSPLAGQVKGIYAMPVISEPKSYSADSIVTMMKSIFPVEPCDSVDDAISRILEKEETPSRILVFGSLYLRVLLTRS